MNSSTSIASRFSANAQKILAKRYLTRDKDGKTTETIEGLFRRVAHAIAADENNYTTAYNYSNNTKTSLLQKYYA